MLRPGAFISKSQGLAVAKVDLLILGESSWMMLAGQATIISVQRRQTTAADVHQHALLSG